MKKAFDQTVRDLKRGVNKKVLKVPSIEQKVLDATSNEPWGPHGSHLADIAQATRNYHEYQMIMSVIWKRINDTGKNWRHVYKALTVLEYLVAHGSERVIDEIREHVYQISTLSDFQYIDSSGRDQGSNVRKKSQSLVVLANDKERIQEVRQKAAANRDKYRSGMYKPGSYSTTGGYGERYDDDRYEGRYGSREEDRNGYGREREWNRDDERYGRYGDSNSRDGDHYGREYEERYGRDAYRDDDSHGRSRSVDGDHYGLRSRNSDRERDRSYEDDGQYSSRVSGAKADDPSQDGSVAGKRLERKFSEQNVSAPPSYEEAVGKAGSSLYSERDGETSTASVPKSLSPQNVSYQEPPTSSTHATTVHVPSFASANMETNGFDEFDPRGSFLAAPTTASATEVDFLGTLSDSFSSNSLAIVPTTTETSEAGAFPNSVSGNAFPSTSTASNQPFEDLFGDGPFRAISSTDSDPVQPQNVVSTSSFHPITNYSESAQQTTQNMERVNNFGFGETDILADILPPSGPSPTGFQAQTAQPVSVAAFAAQSGQPSSQTIFPSQIDQPARKTGFQAQPAQMGQPALQAGFPHQSGQHPQQAGFPHQSGQPASLTGFSSQMGSVPQTGLPVPSLPSDPSSNFYGSFNQQSGSPSQFNTTKFIPQPGFQIAPQMQQAVSSAPMIPSPAFTTSTNSLALVPQPAKDKFETKSTVWTDTLNRGLVNLNISGPKTNPLADIGVDFDAINRKEKRMEKPSATPVISNITMGKAMGSGSGVGRAGAGALRGPSNPMMGSGMQMGTGGGAGAGAGAGAGMVMGMGGVPGVGMGMGGIPGIVMGMRGIPDVVIGIGGIPGAGMGVGGVPDAGMSMGGGFGLNQSMGGMGAGLNMGMGQGVQMQQPPARFPPGSTIPGGYTPMMGTGGYGQQTYGGGYR